MTVEPDDEAAAIEQMISEGAPDNPAARVRRLSYVCAGCGAPKTGPAARCPKCGSRDRLDHLVEPSPPLAPPNGARRGVFFARIASPVAVRAKG
jgi:hypothetical protein